jgi:hypothetical protein
MSEIKVRLSLDVQGAQLLSEQECSKNPKESYNTEIISVEASTKSGKPVREILTINTRKNRIIKQSLNISKEAYNYYVSDNEPPTERLAKRIYLKKEVGKQPNGKPNKVTVETTLWAQYTPKQRLNWHMSKIAESLGAIGYSFEILDD